jgi:uncharacterized protein (DUF983 family)
MIPLCAPACESWLFSSFEPMRSDCIVCLTTMVETNTTTYPAKPYIEYRVEDGPWSMSMCIVCHRPVSIDGSLFDVQYIWL